MRRSISILAITAALFATSPAHTSGIPTFDGANVTQALAQLLQLQLTHGVEEEQLGRLRAQVLEAVKTVAALQKQIDQLERQYDALTGSRGMGDLLNGTTEKKARRIADTLSDINTTLLGAGMPASNPLSAQIATLRDTTRSRMRRTCLTQSGYRPRSRRITLRAHRPARRLFSRRMRSPAPTPRSPASSRCSPALMPRRI